MTNLQNKMNANKKSTAARLDKTKSPIETKIEQLVSSDKLLRAADVARELNLNEKRARSYLRHAANVAEYDTFRNKSFPRDGVAHKVCVRLLSAYKARLSSAVAK